MSLLLTADENGKFLHGWDTDVSITTIIKIHPDAFIVNTLWVCDEEPINAKQVRVSVATAKQFEELFNLQHGTPMQYISEEIYLEFIK